jgi:hypothetical protein
MFQTIVIRNLENFWHPKDLHSGFQSVKDWKSWKFELSWGPLVSRSHRLTSSPVAGLACVRQLPVTHQGHKHHRPCACDNRAVLVLCSQHLAEDRLGMPTTFDVLHRRAPQHGRAASRTESPGRHLLQHPAGVLLLTDISSDASDLPSGLPPLSTLAARTPPWTANLGESPSVPTPQISPPHCPGPPSPLLVSLRRRHRLNDRAVASPAWPHAMGKRAPLFHVGFLAQCKAGPLSWTRLKANGKSGPRNVIS